MKILGVRHYAITYRKYNTARRVFNGQCHRRCRTHDRNSDGNLYVRYLYWNDGQWNWNYNWLDNEWDDQNPAAVSASLFIAPLDAFLGSCVL